MKRFRFFFLTMVVLLVMCLSFTACDSGGGGDSTPTYKVWITNFNFSTSTDPNYTGLGDGRYKVVPLTDSSFEYERDHNYIPNGATQKSLTVDEISNQLVSWGFDSSIARDAANEFTSYSHGEIGLRKGNSLYCILK